MLSASPISVRRPMSARRKRRRQRTGRAPARREGTASFRPAEFRNASSVTRLTYSRRQAAEALGVSITTIDRRVVPAIETVKTPWGQRLIPVDGLERFVHEHLEPGRARPAVQPSGRPPILPEGVVARVRLEYVRGHSFREIARGLTADCVSTAHGGRRWWPSTVRAVLLRSNTYLP